MRPLLCAVLIVILLAPAATAEQPDMLTGIEKQITALCAEVAKKYKIEVSYGVEQRALTSLNVVFGFLTRLQETMDADKENDWKRNFKAVESVGIYVYNPNNKDVIQVRETFSNKSFTLEMAQLDFARLLREICAEKATYLDLSKRADKLKLSLKMGSDVAWSDIAIFIRAMEEFLDKNTKAKRLLKLMTLLMEREVKTPPDYPNRVVPIVYNIDREVLVTKLENYEQEIIAYDKAQKNIAQIEKLGIVMKLSDKLANPALEKIWVGIEPQTLTILSMAKDDFFRGKLAAKPIIFTPEPTASKDDGYYLSIFDTPDAIKKILV